MNNMFYNLMKTNPMFKRAMEMSKGKSKEEMEQIAENLCKQRGINIEDAKKQFSSMFGMNL